MYYSPVNNDTIYEQYNLYFDNNYIFKAKALDNLDVLWYKDTLFAFNYERKVLYDYIYMPKEKLNSKLWEHIIIYPPFRVDFFNKISQDFQWKKSFYNDTVIYQRYKSIDDNVDIRYYNERKYFYNYEVSIYQGITRITEIRYQELESRVIPNIDSVYSLVSLLDDNTKMHKFEKNKKLTSLKIDHDSLSKISYYNIDYQKVNINFDSRFTILHLWFIGCTYCTRVHPVLNKFADNPEISLYSLCVNTGKNIAKVGSYINDFNIQGNSGLLDYKKKDLIDFNIKSYPTIVIYNNVNGTIFHFSGWNEDLPLLIKEFLLK
jgi:thiol-disulfide isomerase/thioredoxin